MSINYTNTQWDLNITSPKLSTQRAIPGKRCTCYKTCTLERGNFVVAQILGAR